MNKLYFWSINLILICILTYIDCHGRLLDPPARSSAWRFYNDSRFPSYFDDMQIELCIGGKCGICGESYTATKQFEKGGSLYRGIIVKQYRPGQAIDIYVELTANHMGWFEFRICNVDGLSTDATQECLDRTLLKDETGNTRIKVPGSTKDFRLKLLLPPNFSCDHCVFQWKYNAGNNWGVDPQTGVSCLGCGKQEQFYGCADVAVSTKDVIITIPTTTTTTTTTSKTTTTTTTTTTTPTKPITTTLSTTSTTSKPSTTTTTLSTTSGTTKPSTTTDTTKISQFTTTTLTSSTSIQAKGKCKYGDGFYPDLENGCKKFYVCTFTGTVNEQIYYFNCGENTLYDYKFKICNYESRVYCPTEY